MVDRFSQGFLVLEGLDGDFAVGHRFCQLLDGQFAVGVEVIAGTVEDGDLSGAVQSGLHTDGGCCAACAHDHQFLALDFHAMLMQVADEAHTIGVVAGQLAVLVHGDGVAGADEFGCGGQLVHQVGDSGLVRHGHVEAAYAQGLEGFYACFHLLQGNVKGQVSGVNAQAFEGVVVHSGGAGVANGGADQAKELRVSRDSAFHIVIPPKKS